VTQERLVAMLSSFFGGLALLLAGIGLYGIVAQAVRTRQVEIGLRMALGAPPAGIVRLVLRRVGVLIMVGLALGLAGSLWGAQFVGPLLFQVEARDAVTFAGATGVLVAAGCWPRGCRRGAPPGLILRPYCAKDRNAPSADGLSRSGTCAFADANRDLRPCPRSTARSKISARSQRPRVAVVRAGSAGDRDLAIHVPRHRIRQVRWRGAGDRASSLHHVALRIAG
jgi:hypothetical protein